jgi:hypothetical protein
VGLEEVAGHAGHLAHGAHVEGDDPLAGRRGQVRVEVAQPLEPAPGELDDSGQDEEHAEDGGDRPGGVPQERPHG